MTAVAADLPTRVQAHEGSVKKLGTWTTSRAFEVRARRGSAVIDLRSPQIPAGDIEVRVDLDRALLKLLVPQDAVIEQWDLRIIGRGRVKDAYGRGEPGGRVVHLVGELGRGAEIRVHRGGVAVLSAMFSREFLADVRLARREGRTPTVADPAGAALQDR
jgi:hypothetical protein